MEPGGQLTSWLAEQAGGESCCPLLWPPASERTAAARAGTSAGTKLAMPVPLQLLEILGACWWILYLQEKTKQTTQRLGHSGVTRQELPAPWDGGKLLCGEQGVSSRRKESPRIPPLLGMELGVFLCVVQWTQETQ